MTTAGTTRARGVARRSPVERAAEARQRAEAARAKVEALAYEVQARQFRGVFERMKRRGAGAATLGAGRVRGDSVYSGSYPAAVRTRLRGGATPFAGSADDHLDPQSRARLRAISQDLLRTSPTARAGFERLSVCNTGPNGLSYQATTADDEWNTLAEAWVEDWWENRFDCRGLMGRVEAQDTILRSAWRDGDLLIVKLRNGSCQIVEGERIGSGAGIAARSTDTYVEGVHMDAAGRPIAFDVCRRVRGGGSHGFGGGPVARVDARDCVYLVNPRLRWSSQTRGEPLLAASLQVFEDITEVTDATVVAARMAAMLAAMIITENPGETQAAMLSQMTDDESGTVAGATQAEQVWKPGSILHLKPGEDVKQMEPKQPGPRFDMFVSTMKRQIGAEIGLPLELLDMDFSKTNFFGTRAAMVIGWLGFGRTQGWLGRRGLSPVTLWALNNAIEDGEVPAHPDWKKHKWVAAPMPAIDEEAMYKAKAVGVAAGLLTHKDAIEQLGGDQAEAMDQMELERKDMARRGIKNAVPTIVSGDPANVAPEDQKDRGDMGGDMGGDTGGGKGGKDQKAGGAGEDPGDGAGEDQ